MSICSLSCGEQATCDYVNTLNVGVEESTCDSAGVCSVDLTCTSSDECARKISAMPVCDNGLCVADRSTPEPTARQTPAPTNADDTPQPTPKVTPAPTDVDQCAELCKDDDTDYKYCAVNADEFGGLFSLDCTVGRNECEAKCLIQEGKDEAMADNALFASDIDAAVDVDVMYATYCQLTTCDTPAPVTPAPNTPSPTRDPDAPTEAPVTPAPVTPSPTLGDCETQCEAEATDYKYCMVDSDAFYGYYTLECTEARNECEAKCLITEGVDEAKIEYADYASTIDALVDLDTVYADHCKFNDDCSAEVTDPVTPAPTFDEPTCAEDDDYLRFDCPDDSGEGCSIQVELALDVCLLNYKFNRFQVYDMIKLPFSYVIEQELSMYDDLCEDSDLRIEVYAVNFVDDAAMQRGMRRPTKLEDCETATEVCGDDVGEMGISVEVSVGFYCGDCDRLKLMYNGLLGLIADGIFDVEYVDKILGLAVDSDSVCLNGFGGAQIATARMVMTDEDGEEIPDTEVNTSRAEARSLVVAAAAVVLAMSRF